MDPLSILDSGAGQDPVPAETQPQDSSRRAKPGAHPTGEGSSTGDVRFPGEDAGKTLAEMAQRDLVATLQLLAERAQYITGATGSAIALRDGEQMLCRASAGTSAPEVGAQLQVNSGLSGESVRTKQTLRCDDAGTDTRVNRESCEALGIASVVVMPLVRGNEVIGVFELFSDKAHVFEARDITALERMGGMVFIALEHALAAQGLAEGGPVATYPPVTARAVEDTVMNEAGAAGGLTSQKGIAFHMRAPVVAPTGSAAVPRSGSESEAPEAEDVLEAATKIESVAAAAGEVVAGEDAVLADLADVRRTEGAAAQDLELPPLDDIVTGEAIRAESYVPATRSAVANLRKCQGCGFPVSEGRELCLDCEKKNARESAAAARTAPATGQTACVGIAGASRSPGESAPVLQPPPLFLREDQEEASWLSSHKIMLGAIGLAVAGILVLLFVR